MPEILSVKGECTFLFSNFLIIGLCDSSANSLLEISFLIAPTRFFIKKLYRLLKLVHVDIHHISDF